MTSTFKSITSKQIYKELSIEQGLDLIQSNKFKKNTEEAQSLISKHGRNSDEYKEFKKKLPCITWAASFKQQRLLTDDCNLSGYVYLDFDNQDVEPDEYTFAQWKSLSGQGIGKLIKVDNLTKSNYKSTYQALLDSYDTADKLSDWTRLNVLVSDNKLYYNDKAKSIQAVEPVVIERKSNIIQIDVNSDKYITDCCKFAYNIAKKKGFNFFEGDKHKSAISFLGSCNQLGVSQYDALNYLNQVMPSKHNEVRAKDVYKRYSHQFRNLILNVNDRSRNHK